MTSRFHKWFTARHRKSVSVAVAGWMSLSLVLVFWPCCEILAQAMPAAPAASHVEAGDHDHGNMPAGSGDPCGTWLDTVDVLLNTSPDVPLSSFELKITQAVLAVAHDFPAITSPARGSIEYRAPPPVSLPLYLRVQHLLI